MKKYQSSLHFGQIQISWLITCSTFQKTVVVADAVEKLLKKKKSPRISSILACWTRNRNTSWNPSRIALVFSSREYPSSPPPLLFLVKNSSLRENIEVASCRWIVVYIYIYTRSTSIEQVEANVLRVCTPVPYPVEHKFNPIYPPSQRDQNVKTNIRVPSSRPPPPPPPLLFPLFGIPRGGKLEQKQLEGGGFFKNCWGKIWKKKRETLIFPIQNSRIIKQSYRIWSIFLFE